MKRKEFISVLEDALQFNLSNKSTINDVLDYVKEHTKKEKKLKIGDYVSCLNEEQFNELMYMQKRIDFLPYNWVIGSTDVISFNGSFLTYSNRPSLKNPLTFEEFKCRFNNTFKS